MSDSPRVARRRTLWSGLIAVLLVAWILDGAASAQGRRKVIIDQDVQGPAAPTCRPSQPS